MIIDSGVDSEKLNIVKDSKSLKIIDDGTIIEKLDSRVTNNHGTIIALIINYMFKEVELISINILDENLNSNGNLLIHSLEKALLYNPDIIHMSLGTKKWKYRHRLKKLIDKAIKKNIVIVSAASNDGKKSYPAYFRNVIGVKSSDIKSKNLFYNKKNFYFAPGTVPQSIYYDECFNLVGNSFAAGYITGYIAEKIYMEGLIGSKQVKDYLKMNL